MEWIIVTDSGCDLLPGDLAPNVRLRRVPLSILLGEEEWVDGPEMDRTRFLAAMEAPSYSIVFACFLYLCPLCDWMLQKRKNVGGAEGRKQTEKSGNSG